MKRASMVGVAQGVTLVLVAGAVIFGYVQRSRAASSPPAPELEAQFVADWRDYANAGQRIGSANAPVTIVEFSDFQCPFCRRLALDLAALRRKRRDQISIVYRHYPLMSIHPFAAAAAVAAECAGDQARFEALHNLMFLRQERLGVSDWSDLASQAGVPDSTQFRACLTRSRPRLRVREDIAAGRALVMRGTPMVMINGVRFDGAPARETLDSIVSDQLAAGRRSEYSTKLR